MALQKEKVIHNLGYFKSLCNRLDNTRQYVDHSLNNNIFNNGNTYSWEFQQIIYLAAIEFECIAKQLILEKDPTFDANSNMPTITKAILGFYPNITKTEINIDDIVICPLDGWRVTKNNGSDKRIGIDWWDAYTHLKHQSFINFNEATLTNAVNALASLMVLELYLAKEGLNTTDISFPYFTHKYISYSLITDVEKQLPDFL